MNSQWDGRPQFYPDYGYELDAIYHAKYLEYCEEQRIGHMFDESNEDSEDSDSSDESISSGSLPQKILDSPPLYDRKDHYHDLHQIDIKKYFLFGASPLGRRLLNAQLGIFDLPPKEDGWSGKLVNRAKTMILKNRKENESIKVARRSAVVIKTRITGLKSGAPTRRIQVPGKIPLATLHDRVLCPVFGWTRGYHDYRFVVPPSGYKKSPPKIPMFDIVFGAESIDTLISLTRHGFWGTLRSKDGPTVCDSTVCVADLLHLPGHRLWHVLALPGWKTEITVEEIICDRDARHSDLLNGNIGGLPENFVIEMNDFDCGGPHAFSLAHEMIHRANQSDDASWMKSYVLQDGRVKESDFDTNRPFDITAARNRLVDAWKGESTPNPEFSQNWMYHMMGTPSSTTNVFETLREQAGVCNYCRRTGERLGVKMKCCGRCKNVNYCSRECQRKDWKTHKKTCYNNKKAK
eukprot:jgi/Psemu1/15633/gm1.15633_g